MNERTQFRAETVVGFESLLSPHGVSGEETMSNHAGSYLLNEVLLLLEERGVFAQMGKESAQRLVLDILKRSRRYGCNSGEILDEIGGRLGICLWCLMAKSDLIDGVCLSCREQEGQT